MNLVFRALNQNGADRVEVVIVTASERTRPCFGHLKGEKQSHITIIHGVYGKPIILLNTQRKK